MYTGSTSSGCANAVFAEIRNTPLESLNTEGFRRRLSAAISHSVGNNSEPCDEDECRLEDKLRIASMYNVHFLPLDTGGATGQAHVYSFDGFPGLYVVRNFLTKAQCEVLLCKTLTEYINPPSNSNLFQLNPKLSGPIWRRFDEPPVLHLVASDDFRKLRWATIGHMYDWGCRSYRGYAKFPDLLVNISMNLLTHFDGHFIPDAAIINCYTKGYFLRLHKDDAEETDDAVLNISLGAPGIFAVGGHDQRTIPVALVVDSGSVVVMAQDSRFCLHGIVKLLKYSKPGYVCHGNATTGDALEYTYAQPRLEKVIPQCPDLAFAGVHCESSALESIRSLASDTRVSVSIRRAKESIVTS